MARIGEAAGTYCHGTFTIIIGFKRQKFSILIWLEYHNTKEKGTEKMKKSTKGYRVIAEFSIIPIGTEKTSLSLYISDAIKALEKVENLKFEVTPMGTILEAESLMTIFQAVEAAHQNIFVKGTKRVVSTLRIDDRRDKCRTMRDKLEALKTQR